VQSERYAYPEQSVKADSDILIPASEQRRRHGGMSRATEERRIKNDPGWPRPVCIARRRYYSDAASRAHLTRLIENGGETQLELPLAGGRTNG
jgi:hypothetical protein